MQVTPPQDSAPDMSRKNEQPLHFLLRPTTKPWEVIIEDDNLARNQKGLVCTAPPPGGFPTVHLRSAPSYNIDPKLLPRWQNKPGPKLWARLFDGAFDPAPLSAVESIRTIIRKLVDAEDVIVAPPMRMYNTYGRLQPPYHFLVSNLSQKAVDTLLEWGTVSTAEATVFFVSYDPPIPTFVMSVCDLTYPLNARSHEYFADFMREKLKHNPAIGYFIQQNLEGPPVDDAYAYAEVKALYASIFVKGFTVHRLPKMPEDEDQGRRGRTKTRGKTRTKMLGPQIVWNVYFGLPLRLSLTNYYALINQIRDLTYMTYDYGVGRVLRGATTLECAGCKSMDHTRALCPFMNPNFRGWLGPRRREVSDQPSSYPAAAAAAGGMEDVVEDAVIDAEISDGWGGGGGGGGGQGRSRLWERGRGRKGRRRNRPW
ncbi:hypothetical protein D9615_008541 [Tricholomella constricta]|uniref:Uncharacterized protein n=1 Tax=Tricholomella constricta TaxID=117010 RepID=A0A8H5H451_9AGAR|nr:hypothetical protein D9615_008541 [Tricholomella constricta]